MANTQPARTSRMTGMALFTAIIVILQFIATFIKFGPVSITLALTPIVVGAAVYGPKAGFYFGGVFGVVVLIGCIFGWDVGGGILWNTNAFLTALICLVKGIAAGGISGLVYLALRKRAPYLAVVLAAIVCPIVNTGLFVGGAVLFFQDVLTGWATAEGYNLGSYIIFGLTGINFIVELVVNTILIPVIARIIRIEKHVR